MRHSCTSMAAMIYNIDDNDNNDIFFIVNQEDKDNALEQTLVYFSAFSILW